jgi:hypothetical protein
MIKQPTIIKYGLLLIIIMSLILLVYYHNTNDKLLNNVSSNSAYKVSSEADYAVSGSIEGLVNFSDYVVTGHYEKFIEDWDMGEKYFSEVYSFVIDSTLYGVLNEKSIKIAIPHYIEMSETIENELYSTILDLPNYSKPDLSKKYVLFLKKFEPKNIYTPASVPFQIEIDGNKKGQLKYNKKTSNSKVVKTKNNKNIEFSFEAIDLGSADKITGLEESEIYSKINEYALKK